MLLGSWRCWFCCRIWIIPQVSPPPPGMSETEVLRAVRSFPAGLAGGPDGVRPQHILEMVDCRETGPELHSVLTGFISCLLQKICSDMNTASCLTWHQTVAVVKLAWLSSHRQCCKQSATRRTYCWTIVIRRVDNAEVKQEAGQLLSAVRCYWLCFSIDSEPYRCRNLCVYIMCVFIDWLQALTVVQRCASYASVLFILYNRQQSVKVLLTF